MLAAALAARRAGAFFTGALAAFVATPCTGPFMGAALGAALVLPAAGALAVFAGLGPGPRLALPAARLRAGASAAAAKAGEVDGDLSAHPLGADVPDRLGPRLDSRAADRSGRDGAGPGGRAALGLALWWLGHGRALAGGRCLSSRRSRRRCCCSTPSPAEAAPAESPLGAEPFSEARLAALRAEGAPVFVYFTADWCLTCKVNERGAMASDAVAEAFPGAEHPRAGRRLDPRRPGDRAFSRAARAARACRSISSIRRAAASPKSCRSC